MNRIVTLDYLRGLAAFGIMVFHYYGHFLGNLHPNDFLGKVGVYGVTIFYVLSGLTLYHVYHSKMSYGDGSIKKFFAKRFFRIYPLLWLSILLTLIVFKRFTYYSGSTLFLNFTGLFGIFSWTDYITAGAWSIGNELVFYLFFPVFVLSLKYKKVLFYAFAAILTVGFLYFTFYVINPANADNWHNYVNPLNQVFYFLGGFCIGAFFEKSNLKHLTAFTLLLLSVAGFILYDIKGNEEVSLYYGYNRLFFSLMCLVACFSLYKLSFIFPAVVDVPLRLLGELSYSVYLLHLIVYKIYKYGVLKFNLDLPPLIGMFTCMAATVITSYIVYNYYEKVFMRWGSKLIYAKKNQEVAPAS